MNLAVTQVAPWSEYIAALQPKFTLAGDKALAEVMPTTTIAEEKLLDALAGSARIAAQRGTDPAAVEPPAQPTVVGADRTASTLPGIPKRDEQKLQSDPILKYTAATALHQEVQLLNRYVADAALRTGLEPYVVRLQLEVLPYARHQPYDLYANIGFFIPIPELPTPVSTPATSDRVNAEATWQKSWGGSGPSIPSDRACAVPDDPEDVQPTGVSVVPLLVTDNLEGALKSRSVDVIRQFVIALRYMQPGAGGAADMTRYSEELNAVLGADINSLLTVGRITDNAISVRLGAAREATAAYAMIPRTHNITLLVMVPRKWVISGSGQRTVRVTANWSLRDVEDGSELKHPADNAQATETERVLRERFRPDPVDAEFTKDAAELRRAIYRNNFAEFVMILDKLGTKYGSYAESPRDIWMDVATSIQASRTTAARFQVPEYRPACLPRSQTVVLLDDGKKNLKVTLRGGRGLVGRQMSARLTVLEGPSSQPLTWASSTIAVGPTGNDPEITFDSFKLWNLSPLPDQLRRSALELEFHGSSRWENASASATYSPLLYRIAAPPKAAAFKLKRSVSFLRAGDREIAVGLAIEKSLATKVAKVEFTVVGADIVSVLDGETPVPYKDGKFSVTKDAALKISLRNLHQATDLVISAKATDSGKKQVGSDHAPLVFVVGEK